MLVLIGEGLQAGLEVLAAQLVRLAEGLRDDGGGAPKAGHEQSDLAEAVAVGERGHLPLGRFLPLSPNVSL